MKKSLSVFLAVLMSVSVLFICGACTKNKTPAEQFRDAAASTVQFFGEFLKPAGKMPDFSEAKGFDTQFSMRLEGIEDGQSTGNLALALRSAIDKATGAATVDGTVTLGDEIAFKGYQKQGEQFLLALPDVSEKYYTLLTDKTDNAESTDALTAIADTLRRQINESSVTAETVEYQIDGVVQKGVKKLTFAADDAQRAEIAVAIVDAFAQLGIDEIDFGEEEFGELTVTLYTYHGAAVGAEFVLASDDGDDRLTGTLALTNRDKELIADGTVALEVDGETIAVELDAKKTLSDAEINTTASLALKTSGEENAEIALKFDSKAKVSDRSVEETGTISLSLKQDGISVGFDIPISATYNSTDDKITGTFECAVEIDQNSLTFSGTFGIAASDSGVTIPDVPAKDIVSLPDDEEAIEELLAAFAEKYPNTVAMFGGAEEPSDPIGPIDPIDPDVPYPIFYLQNTTVDETLDFYSDQTGMVTGYVMYEEKDGQGVVTLDENGTNFSFSYKPFGSDGYEMEQTVQIEGVDFEAIVSEEGLSLTNEEIGWIFWLSSEEGGGGFRRGFTYTQTDDAIQLQVQPGGEVQELKKTGENTYELGAARYEYHDASEFAD